MRERQVFPQSYSATLEASAGTEICYSELVLRSLDMKTIHHPYLWFFERLALISMLSNLSCYDIVVRPSDLLKQNSLVCCFESLFAIAPFSPGEVIVIGDVAY